MNTFYDLLSNCRKFYSELEEAWFMEKMNPRGLTTQRLEGQDPGSVEVPASWPSRGAGGQGGRPGPLLVFSPHAVQAILWPVCIILWVIYN